MTHRKISTFAWVVLLSTLVIIALILVLPDVDLLDTAFHNNTSPLVIHASGTSAPAGTMSVSLFHPASVFKQSGKFRPRADFGGQSPNRLIADLTHCLRC
ncbi:MAG: hypothetical protein WAL32_04680 [Terriglobales bacterium]